VLQQIVNYYPTVKASFSQVKGIFAGSLLKLPIRWSPIYAPYIKKVSGSSITIDGFSPNMDATLYWIATAVERPARDMQNTVSSSRVRYLVVCGDKGVHRQRMHSDGVERAVNQL
jgi:hypothetical protein